MMMRADEMTVGRIVFDPTAPVPANKAYFKVVEAYDEQLGPWVLEQLAGRKRRTVHLPKLDELEPHTADFGIHGLIGQKVRLHLRFGSQATGQFECVEYHELFLPALVERIPVSYLLDGEVYPVADVTRIEVLDD
jgi:hypothetical protein